MVKVNIYPACLKCDCSSFGVRETHDKPYAESIGADGRIAHDSFIACSNSGICKFIDGQEPIEIGNTCTLTYNGEIIGTDAPSYVCDKCGYEANLNDAKFCGGCGASVVEIKG